MASEAVLEEREVLESILADDFEVTSDATLQVKVEPEEGTTSITILVLLKIKYTSEYPDELPEISIEIVQGAMREQSEENDDDDDDEEGEDKHMRLSKADQDTLVKRLQEVGEENLGMAMVYTLVMQLKESLTELLVAKQATRDMEDHLEQMKVQEAELAKPKGTAVTKESFESWRKGFELEMREKRKRQLEDELKALPPKERKERETYEQRLSGRQIFEHKRYKSDGQEEDEDDAADEVDYSKYDRDENRDVVDDKEEGILLADSDSD